MATHRRGARRSQWPVRDLLGEQRSGPSALRDPRLYAAVGGLLACGAAATVAFTASDGAVRGMPDGGGPLALPVPGAVVPAPPSSAPPSSAPPSSVPPSSAPAVPVPAPSDAGPSGSTPGAAAGGSVHGAPSPVPAVGGRRSMSVRQITERMAAETTTRPKRSSTHGVPSPRTASGPAHAEPSPTDEGDGATENTTAGRHRTRAARHDDTDHGRKHRHTKHRHGAHASHGHHRRHVPDHPHGHGHPHGHPDGHGHGHGRDCDADPRHPAMSALGASTGDDRSRTIAAHPIDPGTVLAALDDLQHPDRPHH